MDEDDVGAQKMEALSASDAILFPLLAALTLSSLYFLLKWLEDPAILNKILGYYFAQAGLFMGFTFTKDALQIARSISFPRQYSANGGLFIANNEQGYYEANANRSSSSWIVQNSPLPGFLRRLPLPQAVRKFIWRLRKAIYTKASMKLHVHKILNVKCSVDVLDLVALIIAAFAVLWHTFVSKPWWLTNYLGFSLCYGSLQYFTPSTPLIGTLILAALFFYDIYFVFFTPMMVEVATKLDVPIKLLFPRPDGCVMPIDAAPGSALMEEYLECLAKKRAMAMLGLGDIVVPGMMVAFALRFDLFLFYWRQGEGRLNPPKTLKGTKAEYISATGGWGERLWTSLKLQQRSLLARQFPKTYFNATLVGYLLGLVITIIVMHVTEHAQPALLFLVPGISISLWGTAAVKGNLKLLWNFSEDFADEEHSKKDMKKDEKGELGSEKTSSPVSQQSESEITKRDEEKQGGDPKTLKGGVDLISFLISLPVSPARRTNKPSNQTDPSNVAEDVSSAIAQSMAEEIGNPLETHGNAAGKLSGVVVDELVNESPNLKTGMALKGGPPDKK